MFEQTFVQSQTPARNRWTVAVSLSVQCLGVAILVLIPLLHTEQLRLPDPPQPHLIRTWIDQPPVPPRATRTDTSPVTAPAVSRPAFPMPTIHGHPARQLDIPSGAPEPGVWLGPPTAGIASFPADAPTLPERRAIPPPAAPIVSEPAVPGQLRVGGGVESAKLRFAPKPSYPPLAKIARSQGVVKLEAIIAADGAIRNLRVLSGPPLLVDAALNAVRQWRYQPTSLNGVAVEVVTEIDVNFSLTQ
jgi:protein TonB